MSSHKSSDPSSLTTSSTIQKLKDNLRSKIDNIDSMYHPLDFNTENPEDKLKSLDDSVSQIDMITQNFKRATKEEANDDEDLKKKLQDVIANKADPHELLSQLSKKQNEDLDIDEMLHKGHLNKKYSDAAKDINNLKRGANSILKEKNTENSTKID